MDKRGLTLAFLAAIISGFSIFINSFGVKETNAYFFTFFKNVIVSLFIISFILLIKDYKIIKDLTKRQLIKLGLIGLIGGSIPFLLFFKALQLSNAATSSFVQKSMFIFIAILAPILIKEKLNKKFFIYALFLLIGNALLLKFDPTNITLPIILTLIATIMWSLETIISKSMLKELPTSIIVASRMFLGALFMFPFILASNSLLIPSLEQLKWTGITAIFLLLYLAVYYQSLKTLNVTIASSILTLGAVITTILSLVFLDKGITITQSIGVLLILTSLTLIIGFSNIKSLFVEKWTASN